MSKGYLGIDLGTYNSAVALSLEGSSEVTMLQSDSGLVTGGVLAFPSFLAFNARGEPQTDEFGEPARNKWRAFTGQVVWAFKRLLGRPYEDVAPQASRFRYQIEPDEDGWATAVVGDKKHRPEDLYTLFLEWIRNCATNPVLNPAVGKGEIESTVITVPAYYTDYQVRATLEAAAEAGLPNPRQAAEPVAAMVSYYEDLKDADGQTVMCIDWGAGTLDIAVGVVVAAEDEVRLDCTLVAPVGDPDLGGLDWDYALLEAVIEVGNLDDFAALVRGYRSGDLTVGDGFQGMKLRGLASLHTRVEDAKIDLSTMDVARVEIPGIDPVFIARRSADRSMLPADRTLIFEDVLEQAEILPRFEACLDAALEEVGGPEVVSRLVLVGGPCCSPVVWEIVRRKFAGTPAEADIKDIQETGFPVSPMEAVARGAAILAARSTRLVGEVSAAFDYGIVFEPTDEQIEEEAKKHLDGLEMAEDPAALARAKQNVRASYKPAGLLCIERNDPPGKEATEAISRLGQPGEAMRLALLVRRHEPDGTRRHLACGGFEVVPTYRDGAASVRITLRYTQDRTIDVEVTDSATGASLELRRVDKIPPHAIPEPRWIGDVVSPEDYQRLADECRKVIAVVEEHPQVAVRCQPEIEALRQALAQCDALAGPAGVPADAYGRASNALHALKLAATDEGRTRVPVDVFNRWRERCQALIGLAHRFSPPGADRLVSELEAAIHRCQASRDSEGIDQEAFTPMTMVFNKLKNALLQADVEQADKI